MYKRYFGIKLKITIAFSLVFIALSFSFNLYTYHNIRTLMIVDNNNYLLARANALLSKTEVSPVIIPLPDINTSIRVLYHSNGKPITVFESPGVIKNIKTPAKQGVTDTLGMRVAYVINNSEENPAELMLVRSGKHLADNLSYLLMLLFACSLISVIIAALIAYILAFYLLRPVQRIINAAQVITTNRLRDVIPVKATNDELQELTETINRMLIRIDESLQQQQNFFASASHELKTPLAIMRAEVELELMKPIASDGRDSLLNSQLMEISRLQHVVQEFLLVSQLKNGSILLYKETVDVSSLIVKVFHRLNPLALAKNLITNIEFDRESDNFIIAADLEKLFILFFNILENAIKYSPEGKNIGCHVQALPGSAFLKISIINTTTEKTVATENLQNAFYRENYLQNGAGLGLWLSKEIIKLHNGTIDIKSSNHQFIVDSYFPM